VASGWLFAAQGAPCLAQSAFFAARLPILISSRSGRVLQHTL